jgi:hypothetical protein
MLAVAEEVYSMVLAIQEVLEATVVVELVVEALLDLLQTHLVVMGQTVSAVELAVALMMVGN